MERRVLGAILASSALVAVSALTAGTPADGTAAPEAAAHRTAAGRNGLIAFVRHGEIYKVSPAGGRAVRLTRSQRSSSHPKWSPNGRHIAYVRPGPFNDPYIWVMRADGSQNHRLWKGTAPSWSPSGRRLAYVVEKLEPPTDPNPGCVFHELATRAVAGGPERVIEASGEMSCTSATQQFEYGSTTSWSLDGRVYVGAELFSLSAVQPSPTNPNYDQIVGVIAANSAESVPSTALDHSVGSLNNAPRPKILPTPDAAPNRFRVVYTTPVTTGSGLHQNRVVVEAANSSAAREVSRARFASYPVYSPNGKLVLYVQHRPGHASVINRLNLRTGVSRTIILRATQPDWQPVP